MKSALFSLLAALIVAIPAMFMPAYAQEIDRGAPRPTADVQVAMIFYRMIKQVPDFDGWAAMSTAYIEAAALDKPAILRQKSIELNNIYDLISLREPMIIKTPVRLSTYSGANRGYFIENFKDDTFFGYTFMGENYAVVPQAFMDHQWVNAESNEQVKYIESFLRNAPDRSLIAYLEIIPKSADKTAPLELEGKNYWLIAGEVRAIRLFDQKSKYQLWESEHPDIPSSSMKELLDLKQ